MWLCVHGEKSNLLSWAIRLVFPDPVTYVHVTLVDPNIVLGQCLHVAKKSHPYNQENQIDLQACTKGDIFCLQYNY